jgi:hypothetical protein
MRHSRWVEPLAPFAVLIYFGVAGETQTPRQTVSVQALCNTRRFEEFAHGR